MADSKFNFEPLIKTSTTAGTTDYNQVVNKSFFGIQLMP